ncbi:MAG: hypothetical protein AAGG01_13685 [Planctomycetota bacterium]
MLRCSLLASAALAASFLCRGAWAQGVTYLDPSHWHAHPGDLVTVRPKVLHRTWDSGRKMAGSEAAAARKPEGIRRADVNWRDRMTSVLFVRGAGTQTNHDAPPVIPAEDGAPSGAPANGDPARRLRFQPAEADTWMVGADWAPRTERVLTSHLSSFLALHGEAWPAALPADREYVRVARYESSKVLSVVPDANGRSGSSGTAMSKTAQHAQLRPLNDPCMTVPGTLLLVRLYLPEGVPLARTGTATQLASGETVSFAFDSMGFGALEIPSAGPWLLEVHAVAAPGETVRQGKALTNAADLVMHSVTFAFEAPPAAPREKTDAPGEER